MPSLTLPPHVKIVRARGREYTYFEPHRGTARAGKRVAIPGLPRLPDGTPNPEWWIAYRQVAGLAAPSAPVGTFSALSIAWQASPEWRQLSTSTRAYYARRAGEIEALWGRLPVRGLTASHVLQWRDAGADQPAAANQRIAVLSAMLAWSIPRGFRSDNPCEHVPALPRGEPYAAWGWAAIEAWRALAVPEMRLVMALALYTGQRRSDLLTMTWSDVDQGAIRVVHDGIDGQQKTGKRVWVPLHRDLRAELALVERRSVRIITGADGQPFSLEGLKTAWQRQHEALELMTGDCHGLVLHGLRKSAVCFLLEAGCSEEEVEAITRQSRDMIRHYSADLNRQRLAERAIARWEGA